MRNQVGGEPVKRSLMRDPGAAERLTMLLNKGTILGCANISWLQPAFCHPLRAPNIPSLANKGLVSAPIVIAVDDC